MELREGRVMSKQTIQTLCYFLIQLLMQLVADTHLTTLFIGFSAIFYLFPSVLDFLEIQLVLKMCFCTFGIFINEISHQEVNTCFKRQRLSTKNKGPQLVFTVKCQENDVEMCLTPQT